MDLALLERTLAELGQPAYRVLQVWEATTRGATSYDEMTTLPKPLRSRLAEAVPFSTLEVVEQREARDGTVKTLTRRGCTRARPDRRSLRSRRCSTAHGYRRPSASRADATSKPHAVSSPR